LLERCGEPRLLLRVQSLALREETITALSIGLPTVELIESSGELLFLLEDAAFDFLEFPLAGPSFLVELGAHLEGVLLGFELAGADLGFRLPHLGLGVARGLIDQPLGVLQDSLCPSLGVTQLAGGVDLLEEVPDEERKESNQRQQPDGSVHRSLHSGTGAERTCPICGKSVDVPKKLMKLEEERGGDVNDGRVGRVTPGEWGGAKAPASAVCRRCFEPGMTRWAPEWRASGFPSEERRAHHPRERRPN